LVDSKCEGLGGEFGAGHVEVEELGGEVGGGHTVFFGGEDLGAYGWGVGWGSVRG
jgi:hypothetical protein